MSTAHETSVNKPASATPSKPAPDSGNGTLPSNKPGTSGEELLGRVVHGAHATIDRLAETAAPHVQQLEEGMASASDALHARADQARETRDEWAETLRCTVRENPLAAVATALAVGLLIARLTR